MADQYCYIRTLPVEWSDVWPRWQLAARRALGACRTVPAGIPVRPPWNCLDLNAWVRRTI